MFSKRQFYTVLHMIALAVLLIANGFILDFILNIESGIGKDKLNLSSNDCTLTTSQNLFGFNVKDFHVDLAKMPAGESLSSIFSQFNIPRPAAEKVIKGIGEIVNLSSIKAGNTIGFVASNLCIHPDYFIYEIDPSRFLVSELRGNNCVVIHEREKEYKRENAAGIIESSLWNALESQNLSLNLIDQMEDALSSSVDFHHVQKGDEFKLIYDRLYIDGKPTQNGELIAAYFETEQKDYYSFSYEVNNRKGYYDINGSPMKSRFLKAPVRFSRISSGFNLKRFHPVLKYHRPHLGTDYAAPHGTPIMAVGSGVIEAASYTGGNGNYVKIRHDKTYQTQYLHMSRFAKGIRRGTPVSQGQVIGYVGSTGLASGPHVCFRFWKNGKQVNHRRLIFPAPEPLPQQQIKEYFKYRDELVRVFESIQFTTAINNNPNS